MDTNADPSGPPAGTAALNQPIDTSLPLSYNPDFAQLRETVERTQDDVADMKARPLLRTMIHWRVIGSSARFPLRHRSMLDLSERNRFERLRPSRSDWHRRSRRTSHLIRATPLYLPTSSKSSTPSSPRNPLTSYRNVDLGTTRSNLSRSTSLLPPNATHSRRTSNAN